LSQRVHEEGVIASIDRELDLENESTYLVSWLPKTAQTLPFFHIFGNADRTFSCVASV
jgi:hypothetical protein